MGNYRRYSAGGELKYFDSFTANPTNITAIVGLPGGFFQLFSVSSMLGTTLDTGVGPSQRVGRKITLKNIQTTIQIQTSFPAATDPVPNMDYRVDLVLDKQTNGGPYAAPGNVGTDLYDFTATQNPVQCFLNLSNENRFTILKRWEGNISTDARSVVGASTTGGIIVDTHLKSSKKCNIPVEFLGVGAGSGSLANIRSNNVFLLYTFAASSAGIAAVNLVQSGIRTRYIDN